MSTFDLEPVPRYFPIFPRQIVVFVRMPGCSSLAVFARYRRSSPLIVLSESLLMTIRIDFTVCSRIIGAVSVKPVTIMGKILPLMSFGGMRSIMRGRLSSRHTLIARSGLAKSRTINGASRASNSSSESFPPIFIIALNTFGPPPPNSTDFCSSGRIFILKKSSGKSSVRRSSSLKLSAASYISNNAIHLLKKLISFRLSLQA